MYKDALFSSPYKNPVCIVSTMPVLAFWLVLILKRVRWAETKNKRDNKTDEKYRYLVEPGFSKVAFLYCCCVLCSALAALHVDVFTEHSILKRTKETRNQTLTFLKNNFSYAYTRYILWASMYILWMLRRTYALLKKICRSLLILNVSKKSLLLCRSPPEERRKKIPEWKLTLCYFLL